MRNRSTHLQIKMSNDEIKKKKEILQHLKTIQIPGALLKCPYKNLHP